MKLQLRKLYSGLLIKFQLRIAIVTLEEFGVNVIRSYFYKEHFEVNFLDSSAPLSSKIPLPIIAAANTEAIASYITHRTLSYIWLCVMNGCSSQSQTQLESAASD